jgi:hypothetical protein
VTGIVTGKKRVRRPARTRGLAGLGIIGIIAVASLVGGWGVSPVETSEISPADIVALRFPPNSNDEEPTPSIPPNAYALASASESQIETSLLFSPYQTFPAQAISLNIAMPAAQPAGPEVATPAPQPMAAPEKAAIVRAATPLPERRPPPRVRKDSGALFNDAQLASIKARLKLTAYQEQYWPPVESALRDIGLRAAHSAVRKTDPRGSQTRVAEIDPNGEEVQRLKSAAFPLIMSMNDDQKREVRTLAMVMGLERVAASF